MMKIPKILVAVLLVGCAASSVRADSWTNTGSLNIACANHTATLLLNGMVLVAGGTGTNGYATNSAELYDPTSGTWANTGSLKIARYWHTAALLPNGNVLVAGGYGPNGSPTNSAELYDPASGTWTATGSMSTNRYGHTATLLPNGKVLVAGGRISTPVFPSTCELYDPANGTWTNTGSLNIARYRHTATSLTNGMVLVAGGYNPNPPGNGYVTRSERYDPASGTWTIGSFTGTMRAPCQQHTATLLPNGNVLVAGGSNGGIPFTTAELYNPASDLWTNTGSLNIGRYLHTATLLPNGKVLVAGGIPSSFPVYGTNSAEVYDPASGTWATTALLNTGRYSHTATLLTNGMVLVAGGTTNGGTLVTASAELYAVSSVLPPLSISLLNNTVTVWWQDVPGWALQQNGDLNNPNGWSASSGVTNTNGTNFLNLANPSDNLFFRLH
jgi:N-acetylneuraminic acid mutarotase